MIYNDNDTIVAPATPTGGALCLIRLSGERAIGLCDEVFEGRRSLAESKTATAHYGLIKDGEQVVDDVVVTLFRAPHSYTGEDSVEISAHGSRYVVGRILSLLMARGARLAEAGEFTRRAFFGWAYGFVTSGGCGRCDCRRFACIACCGSYSDAWSLLC